MLRLRMTAPARLEGEMIVVDPDALTAPRTSRWSTSAPTALDRLICDTFTNDRSEVENGVFAIEPPDEAAE
jgi:hypothetical protein